MISTSFEAFDKITNTIRRYISNLLYRSTTLSKYLLAITHRIMAADVLSINWSSRLRFQPVEVLNDGGSHSLQSHVRTNTDKIILPPSVLKSLLNQSMSELPSPLIFRLNNPSNGKITHVGVREFSSAEGNLNVPLNVAQELGLERENDTVIVQFVELPKATSLTLKPLRNDYEVDDWKVMLEAQLNNSYTAMTKGGTLTISDPLNIGDSFDFLIEDVQPADAVCIVDTDVNLDVSPPDQDKVGRASTSRKTFQAAPLEPQTVSTNTKINQHFEKGKVYKFILPSRDMSLQLSVSLSDISADDPSSINIFIGDSELVTSTASFIWSTLNLPNISNPLRQVIINPSDLYNINQQLQILVQTTAAVDATLTMSHNSVQAIANESNKPDIKLCSNCPKQYQYNHFHFM